MLRLSRSLLAVVVVVVAAAGGACDVAGGGEGEGEGEEGEGEGEGERCGLVPDVDSPYFRNTVDNVLLFRAEEGATQVILSRRFKEIGVGESGIFEGVVLGVSVDGVAWSCSGDVDYENTHHNWLDVASATVDGVPTELRFDFLAEGGAQETLVRGDTPVALDFVPPGS